MVSMYRQVKTLLGELEKMIPKEEYRPGGIEYRPCGYRKGDAPPEEGFMPFENGGRLGPGMIPTPGSDCTLTFRTA